MPRKKSRADLVVLPQHGLETDERVALPSSERRLNFGDRWGYAPAPEASDYIRLQKRYPLFIGGKFVAPKSPASIPIVRPPKRG